MADERIQRLLRNWERLVNGREAVDGFFSDLQQSGPFDFRVEAAGWKNLVFFHDNRPVPFHRCDRPFNEWDDHFSPEERPEILACLGTGFGYQIPALLGKASRIRNIVIAETQPKPLEIFLGGLELTHIIPAGVELIYAPRPDILAEFLSSRGFRYRPTDIKLIALESVFNLERAYLDLLVRHLEERSRLTTVYLKTLEEQHSDLTANVLDNLGCLHRSYVLREGSGKGRRAVIAAAGPSLDLNMPLLPAVAESAQLIAVGSALNSLLEAGVKPDMVVVSDPKASTLFHFPQDNYPFPLALDLTVAPDIAEKFAGKHLITNVGHSVVRLLEGAVPTTRIGCWGTVTSAALALCAKAGFEEVVLLGTDFSYTEKETHAAGYLIPQRLGKEIKMIDTIGKPVRSTDVLADYQRYVKEQIRQLESNGISVVNANEGGILDAGKQMTLREYLARLRCQGVLKKRWVWWRPIGLRAGDLETLAESLQVEMKAALETLQSCADNGWTLNRFFVENALAGACEGAVVAEARALEEAVSGGNRGEIDAALALFTEKIRGYVGLFLARLKELSSASN